MPSGRKSIKFSPMLFLGKAPIEATTVILMPYAPIQMEDIHVLANKGTPVQSRIVQVCICHQVGKIFNNLVKGPLNP